MDAFEVRLQFLEAIERFNGSYQLYQKVAEFCLKNAEYQEYLHSVILERIRNGNINARLEAFCFLEVLILHIKFKLPSPGQWWKSTEARPVPYVEHLLADMPQLVRNVIGTGKDGLMNIDPVYRVLLSITKSVNEMSGQLGDLEARFRKIWPLMRLDKHVIADVMAAADCELESGENSSKVDNSEPAEQLNVDALIWDAEDILAPSITPVLLRTILAEIPVAGRTGVSEGWAVLFHKCIQANMENHLRTEYPEFTRLVDDTETGSEPQSGSLQDSQSVPLNGNEQSEKNEDSETPPTKRLKSDSECKIRNFILAYYKGFYAKGRMKKEDILERMNEDRERHKQQKEASWYVEKAADPGETLRNEFKVLWGKYDAMSEKDAHLLKLNKIRDQSWKCATRV